MHSHRSSRLRDRCPRVHSDKRASSLHLSPRKFGQCMLLVPECLKHLSSTPLSPKVITPFASRTRLHCAPERPRPPQTCRVACRVLPAPSHCNPPSDAQPDRQGPSPRRRSATTACAATSATSEGVARALPRPAEEMSGARGMWGHALSCATTRLNGLSLAPAGALPRRRRLRTFCRRRGKTCSGTRPSEGATRARTRRAAPCRTRSPRWRTPTR